MADPRALAGALGPLGLWSSAFLSLPPAELSDAARLVEGLGFGALWLPESTWMDPFVGAALALAGTSRLRVATGVARIHARAPIAMSNAWRGLSAAFPDRFVLGLGVSHQVTVEQMGKEYSRPLSAMRQYLDDLAAVRWDGPVVGAEGAPTHMVLAALGPKMLELAAGRSDGAHPYTSTASHSAGARRAMGPVPLLAPEVKVVFEADPAAARAIGRRWLPLALPNYSANLVRSGFDPDAVKAKADDVVDALVGWGSDDAIEAHLRSHLDVGADHVAVQVLTSDGGPAPREAWRRLGGMFRSE
jgi:probable F420-dependent oxidoreductase